MACHPLMNKLRYSCWLKLVGSSKTLCPPLQNLPPIDSSFVEYLKRAICQFIKWKHADQPHHPSLDSSKHGYFNEGSRMMPVTVLAETEIAPDAEQFSKSKRCSCASNSLNCTRFCKCCTDGTTCMVRCY